MVIFTKIQVQTKSGEILRYSSLKFFNEYRETYWKTKSELARAKALRTAEQHRTIEKSWEKFFNLAEGQLQGYILLFGSVRRAADNLFDQETRDFFLDPTTEVELTVHRVGNLEVHIKSSKGSLTLFHPSRPTPSKPSN